MKYRSLIYMTAACLLAAMAITIQLFAQDKADHNNNGPRYRLVDLGTFGGPNSIVPTGPPLFKVLNNQGVVVGAADTSTPDPYPYCMLFCYVSYASKWQNGVLTDLGTLPGVTSSIAFGLNETGMIVGLSENGSIDPLTGYPEYDAIVWNNGRMSNLGTFGGSISAASAVNDWGQVAGEAANTIPDSYASSLGPCATLDCWPLATQLRAFLWQNGRKQDLGTLGGNDAAADLINDLGMVAGVSYTDTTPSDLGIPTMDPFVWIAGRMVDLGTLGSGHFSYPNWMNLWGQTVGNSAPADYWYHAFIWSGGRMQDLGLPLGGDFSTANWINDAGQVVGDASLSGDQAWHAVTWTNGRATDLGVVAGDTCSDAESINVVGQIVGNSGSCSEYVHGFLWQSGVMYDLNTLIPPGSNLVLKDPLDINDDGEITGGAALPDGTTHAFLLIPCDEHDPGGCRNQLLAAGENTNQSSRSQQRVKSGRDPLARFHAPSYPR
jgi:probable HAF family extracellular repeat protein